jgi:putative FmdB family regulatory protein
MAGATALAAHRAPGSGRAAFDRSGRRVVEKVFRRIPNLPLYEYECPKCGTFELVRKFSDAPLESCPTCARPVEKLASAPAIQFKGTGWYITDYARKSSGGEGKEKGGAKESKEAASTSSSETKSASSETKSGTSSSEKK